MSTLISARDLAERLGLREGTVRKWAREGKLQKITLGPKCVRFDLDAALKALGLDSGNQNKKGGK